MKKIVESHVTLIGTLALVLAQIAIVFYFLCIYTIGQKFTSI